MYKKILVSFVAVFLILSSFLSGYLYSEKKSSIKSFLASKQENNPSGTIEVNINGQPAYFRKSNETNRPLLVRLHSWSGTYKQEDPLSSFVANNDWNYIRPDFQGQNNHPNSCASDLVIEDIDNAISYAIENGSVDYENIFVIGESGGGYAALVSFMHSKHDVNTFLSWVPITDLEAWYYESLTRNQAYANDVLQCTGSEEGLDGDEARKRSPLYMDTPIEKLSETNLMLFTGVHDGYSGSVPITHAINFYNKLAAETGNEPVPYEETIKLLSKDVRGGLSRINERDVFLQKSFGNTSLTVFDGGHETLVEYTEELLNTLSK